MAISRAKSYAPHPPRDRRFTSLTPLWVKVLASRAVQFCACYRQFHYPWTSSIVSFAKPWDRVNTIRTLVATGVLILEAVTLSLWARDSESVGFDWSALNLAMCRT